MIRKESEDEALLLWHARRGLVAEFYLRVVRLLWLRFGAGSSRSKGEKKEREKQVEQAFSVFLSFVLISLWIKWFQKWGRPLNDWNDSCLLLVLLANSFVSRVFLIDRSDRCCRENADEYARSHSTNIDPFGEFWLYVWTIQQQNVLAFHDSSSFHCGILFWLFTFTHDGKATWNEYNFSISITDNSRTVNLR